MSPSRNMFQHVLGSFGPATGSVSGHLEGGDLRYGQSQFESASSVCLIHRWALRPDRDGGRVESWRRTLHLSMSC